MGFFDSIGSAFKSFGHTVSSGFKSIGSGVSSAFNWGKNAVSDVAKTAYSLGKGVVDRVSHVADVGMNVVDKLGTASGNVLDGIGGLFKGDWLKYVLIAGGVIAGVYVFNSLRSGGGGGGGGK
jgi:hypothetical protein